MMPALLVLIAVICLFVLTVRAMKRLWRAQVLRLLAAFMRRGLPLEPALASLGQLGGRAGEAPLVRLLAFRLARGQNLAEALREMRIISSQQAVALSLAQEQGAAGGVLAELAARATRGERQALSARALAIYPLLMGTVLLSNTLFIVVFIAPKLEQMFKEMEISVPVVINCHYSLWCVGALLAWGVLAAGLHSQWLGRRLWWHVPLLREPFCMDEQAVLARNLGVMLDAGATLERAVSEIAAAGAGGPMQRTMGAIAKALDEGVRAPEAFRAAGHWREEFLWAVDAVSEGVPPRLAFGQVATVLEDKAASRFNTVYRICTPLAVLLAAAGVGLLGWTIFSSFGEIARSMLG